VHDPRKQERRRRLLKERRAAELRENDQEEAKYLLLLAGRSYRAGDVDSALKSAKKALHLDPDLYAALDLLAEICFRNGQYEEAVAYLSRLRERPDFPSTNFNLALAHLKLGRKREALKSFQDFLDTTASLRGAHYKRMRESAKTYCVDLAKETAQSSPPPVVKEAPAPKAPPPPPPPPAPPPKPEPPRVLVDFLPAPPPAFDRQAGATVADYLLRRRLLELRLAQNFEDLICLPSLHGVDTYVYQQETVRRVLRHYKGRALLADETGLGKTIEACLVLKEYWARGMVRKALVLTPPSLVSQWKGELVEKFGLAPVSPEDFGFRSNPAQFWQSEPLVVASIALARMEPHASTLAEVPWDLVIVDEAHCLKNRTSSNWKLVNSLQKKFILMLTATPVENNLVELYNLITVLKPGLLATETEFRKLFILPGKPKSPRNPERLRELLTEVMVRNTRSAVDVRLPHRIAASVVVPPSPAEAELYQVVSDYVARRYREAKGGTAGFTLHQLQRQAGSSAHALGRAVGRALAADKRPNPQDLRDLERMQELAAQVSWTGKSRQLASMLSERQAKTVVFTEFAPTLEHLAEVCEDHSLRYAMFSGDMSKAAKDAAIARFRDEADVLLSTGAGGEGRNLQFANTVINFDLPWNPMRLEQRVGRVHRIGQTQEVFVFNFCQADTVEEQLLRLLHDKINMFELVVGEVDAILGTLDEGDFAELVLDLWLSARDSGRIDEAFDELADRLLEAKKQYSEAKQLDETLFQRDFEV